MAHVEHHEPALNRSRAGKRGKVKRGRRGGAVASSERVKAERRVEEEEEEEEGGGVDGDVQASGRGGKRDARSVLRGVSMGASSNVHSKLHRYREAFNRFDMDKNGSLDLWELRHVFQSVGIMPSEAELYQIASAADTSGDGSISFSEFVALLESGANETEDQEEVETLEAFVALGGNPDKTGSVDTDKMKQIISDFGLTVEIDSLLDFLDTDKSGYVDYLEFRQLLQPEQEEGLI